jgi:transposase
MMADTSPKFAVTKLDPEAVIAQYLEGKTSQEIAKANGISRQALQAWLIRNDAEGWKTAQTVVAQEELDEARDYRASIQARLETADREERERLNIALACARDAEKSAQWRLERVCRRIYGQDAPASAAQAVQININMRAAEPQLVELDNNDQTQG